jgi:hypothetical protein
MDGAISRSREAIFLILVFERVARPFFLKSVDWHAESCSLVTHQSRQERRMYDWKPKMQKIARHFAEQVHGIRTGTVDRGVIQAIRVDLQGNAVPIRRLGVIKLQGDRTQCDRRTDQIEGG